jgi:hypothetical protein
MASGQVNALVTNHFQCFCPKNLVGRIHTGVLLLAVENIQRKFVLKNGRARILTYHRGARRILENISSFTYSLSVFYLQCAQVVGLLIALRVSSSPIEVQ